MSKLNIYSKSILKKISINDGLRVCVMRRIKPEYKFDIWIPMLAPPEKLLNDYIISKKINWKKFSEKFNKQVLSNNKHLIRILISIAKIRKVTLLCFEEVDDYCHRSLIIKECKKL